MTVKTKVLLGQEARQKLSEGMNILAEAVKSTMGPNGRHVVIGNQMGEPHVTKDGVTVANHIFPENEVHALGASLIRQASQRTAEQAGDGTSTSAVLAQSLITSGLNAINNGANPVQIIAGMEKACKSAIEGIKSLSRGITDTKELIDIATISANNDSELGKIIADVVYKVGGGGYVDVVDSKTTETYAEVVGGMQLERGFNHIGYANNPKNGTAEYVGAKIIVADYELQYIDQMEGLLRDVAASKQPILFIAKSVEGEVLNTLLSNKINNNFQLVSCNAPGHGELRTQILQDIAVFTGARLISPEYGLELKDARIGDAGTCERIVVSKDKTVIIGGNGNPLAIKSRAETLGSQIKTEMHPNTKTILKKRYSNLAGGIGVIHVGGQSDSDIKEKKDRIDDAVCATMAAFEEGYVAGGGTTYLRIAAFMNDVFEKPTRNEQIGVEILKDALTTPFKIMMDNAGLEKIDELATEIVNMPYGIGYDAKNGVKCDVFKAGVVDPVKVARVALESAVGVAKVFLTTNCVTHIIKEAK